MQADVFNREVLIAWTKVIESTCSTELTDSEHQCGNSATGGRSCLMAGAPAPSLMTFGSRVEGFE